MRVITIIIFSWLYTAHAQSNYRYFYPDSLNDNLLSASLSNSHFCYSVSTDGEDLLLLNGNHLFIVDMPGNKITASQELKFIKTENHRTLLVTSADNLPAVLTYDTIQASNARLDKLIKLYELNNDLTLKNIISFRKSKGSILSESELSGINHYLFAGDTLIMNAGGYNTWFIRNDVVMHRPFVPIKPYETVDFFDGTIYKIRPEQINSGDSLLNKISIYKGDQLILNLSKDSLSRNINRPGLTPVFICNKKIYFDADQEYCYDIITASWQQSEKNKNIYACNYFDGGFYFYEEEERRFCFVSSAKE